MILNFMSLFNDSATTNTLVLYLPMEHAFLRFQIQRSRGLHMIFVIMVSCDFYKITLLDPKSGDQLFAEF